MPPTGLSATIPQYLSGYAGALITFDDADASIYNLAYPILQAKRARATFYVITSQVGTGAYVTWGQLTEMQTAGWSIGNHTQNHAHLNALSLADATAEIVAGITDLQAQSMNAALHLSYPFGEYNAQTIAAAQAAGCLTGRTIDGGWIQLGAGYNLFTIGMRMGIINTDALITMENFSWDALRDKKVVHFLIHTIGPAANITAANLTALVDYIAECRIPFITIEDLYDAMSGSITVPIGP